MFNFFSITMFMETSYIYCIHYSEIFNNNYIVLV